MSFPIRKELFQIFRKHETRVHALSYLFWECTTRCNLNCRHCGSDCSKDPSSPDMPLTGFLRAIQSIPPPRQNTTIVLSGGEPLMRRDIEECGKALRKMGFRWGLVSNGFQYDERRHVSLLNAGLGALTLSLDGLEENHNWLRQSKQSFSKVDRALELAVSSNRLNFDVVTCVNQKNVYELPHIRDYLIRQGVKAWRLFTIIPIGRAKEEQILSLTNEQFVLLMDFIVAERRRKALDVKFSCEGYLGRYENRVRDGFFFCRAGINIGSILIDGSISACPNIDRSFSQGNIYQDSFFEIWQTQFEKFRNRDCFQRGQCLNCNDFRFCQGNGMHNWHGNMDQVLVCHKEKVDN